MIEIDYLDHLVLTVKDIERTVSFYEKTLGMQRITFGEGRLALAFGSQKINLHQLGEEFEPNADNVEVGSADLCFILKTPIDDALKHLVKCGIEILEGPVSRTGTVGKIISLYFRDPNLNLIEVSSYR